MNKLDEIQMAWEEQEEIQSRLISEAWEKYWDDIDPEDEISYGKMEYEIEKLWTIYGR